MDDDDVVRFPPPPERIPLDDGMLLRRHSPADVDGLTRAVSSSLDHLRPWMPWAQGDYTIAQAEEFLRASVEAFEAGTDFGYAVVDPTGAIVGGVGLHARRGPDELEIGYWVAADHAGRGIGTAAARAATAAAARVAGVARVVICCDEANRRSAAIPRRLGFALVAVEERPVLAAAETGRHQVWVLDLARQPTRAD